MIFSDFWAADSVHYPNYVRTFRKFAVLLLTFDSRTLGTIVSENSATIKYVLSWSSLNEQELELKKF